MDLGLDLEEALIRQVERRLSVTVERGVRLVDESSHLSATLDGRFQLEGKDGDWYGVEAKSSNEPGEWGDDEMSDQVPPRVALQCQVQCYVGGLVGVYVPVLTGSPILNCRIYWVPRDTKIIEQVIRMTHDFWVKHVVPRRAPQATERAYRHLQVRERVERKHMSLAPDLWKKLEKVQQERKKLEKVEKELKVQVLALMGDAEIADVDEEVQLTYFEHSSTRYSEKSPEPCSLCGVGPVTSKYRTLRQKKGKLYLPPGKREVGGGEEADGGAGQRQLAEPGADAVLAGEAEQSGDVGLAASSGEQADVADEAEAADGGGGK